MALVRRAVGRAQVPGTAAAPIVPQQPGGPAGHTPGAPGQEMAAAAPSSPATGLAVLGGFGLAAAGAVGAWNIGVMAQPAVFEVGSPMATFGALFVFAAAVERLLEPITRWLPGRDSQQHYEKAMADMENGVPGAIQAAAHHKAAADSARASKAILMWGIATFVATLLSAAGGFYLLRQLSANPGWSGVSTWVDALITGLVVGTGTKPLHDLVTRMQADRS